MRSVDDETSEGAPVRQVRLRGGPFNGKTVWWSGGSLLDVPTADGVKIWDPAVIDRPDPLVLSDVRYRRSADDEAVFDYVSG